MGKIIKTRMHCDGEIHDGEAMLETTELLFQAKKFVILTAQR